jgi:SAM-dependent methyltransferase
MGASSRLLRLTSLGRHLPAGWGRYPESRLAHQMLDGLSGIEIGGSASNAFGLNSRNVDNVDHERESTVYAHEQRRVCGTVMPVDVTASGLCLPFADQSEDFVIASHVIEHFYDPISAIFEWVRIARRYVYLVVPHKDRTFDHPRPVTSVQELLDRHHGPIPDDAAQDRHWSVWRTEDFVELIEFIRLPIAKIQDADDKIGNGFAVVIGDLSQWDRTKAWRGSQEFRPFASPAP